VKKGLLSKNNFLFPKVDVKTMAILSIDVNGCNNDNNSVLEELAEYSIGNVSVFTEFINISESFNELSMSKICVCVFSIDGYTKEND
jgi:hypothetical protein